MIMALCQQDRLDEKKKKHDKEKFSESYKKQLTATGCL
jgi:hypothetical protein